MASCPKIITEPYQVSTRLAEIGGLTERDLVEAGLVGELARQNVLKIIPSTLLV